MESVHVKRVVKVLLIAYYVLITARALSETPKYSLVEQLALIQIAEFEKQLQVHVTTVKMDIRIQLEAE